MFKKGDTIRVKRVCNETGWNNEMSQVLRGREGVVTRGRGGYSDRYMVLVRGASMDWLYYEHQIESLRAEKPIPRPQIKETIIRNGEFI